MASQPVGEDYPEIEKCFPYDPSGRSLSELKFKQFKEVTSMNDAKVFFLFLFLLKTYIH